MINTPNFRSDRSRTQPVVDALLKGAASGRPTNRNATEVITVQRGTGRRGPGIGSGVYDFGTTYSVPAVVENGKIRRLDGKPYKS